MSGEDRALRQYEPLVRAVVGRLCRKFPSWVDRDGMYWTGMSGLSQAWRTFDNARGRFEPYASMKIWAAVMDERRNDDWLPKRLRRQVRSGDVNIALVGDSALMTVADSHGDPGSSFEIRDLCSVLLQRLRPPEREVIMLRYWQDLKMKDIAQRIGVGSSRVPQIIRSALERMRPWLRREMLL